MTTSETSCWFLLLLLGSATRYVSLGWNLKGTLWRIPLVAQPPRFAQDAFGNKETICRDKSLEFRSICLSLLQRDLFANLAWRAWLASKTPMHSNMADDPTTASWDSVRKAYTTYFPGRGGPCSNTTFRTVWTGGGTNSACEPLESFPWIPGMLCLDIPVNHAAGGSVTL